MWDDLDDELKTQVLESKVKFLGRTSQVKHLKPWYNNRPEEWNDFLSEQIDAFVIQQVINGEVLKMNDLEQGFIKVNEKIIYFAIIID